MSVPKEIVEQRMGAFMAACVEQGIKITHQRMEIFRELASTEEHPDTATIHTRVKKRIPTISLDTVYRNLKLLAEHGVITAVGMSQDRQRFDANMEEHHHFVCVKCGMVRDFHTSLLGPLATPEEAKAFGVPVSMHLEVKGVCRACAKPARIRQRRA